jgi:hypothetical protein
MNEQPCPSCGTPILTVTDSKFGKPIRLERTEQFRGDFSLNEHGEAFWIRRQTRVGNAGGDWKKHRCGDGAVGNEAESSSADFLPVNSSEPSPPSLDIEALLTRKYGVNPDGTVGTEVRPEYERGDDVPDWEARWR